MFALRTLFPKRFYLPSSQDQLDLIEFIKQTIRTGGQLAVAMPRSTGKTNILLCSIIWAILTGLHPFVLLVGASATASRELLEQIQTEFQTNDRLLDYFPELIHPIRKLEGISQRRLLWNGKLIVQTWKKDSVILPNNIAGPGHGAVIAVAGLDGRIRGLNYQRHDGQNVRPSLVLVDDPQTRKTAASIPSTNKRELVLNGDIMGLAGPDKQIACLVACTVIQTGDLSDRILDRNKNPQWQGRRTKLLRSLPTNMDLWDEFGEILRADLRDGLGWSRANAFYAKNQTEMDVGADPSWPARFKPYQLSAIQYAMELKILEPESFHAEYQNEPLKPIEDASLRTLLTCDDLLQRMNRLERGRVPLDAQHLTAYVDVHKNLLFWVVCWWKGDFTGGVLDYGVYPKQDRNHFTLSTAAQTIQTAEKTKRSAVMPAVRVALDAVIDDLMTRQWRRDGDGPLMRIDRLGIDGNWGDSTKTVSAAIRESKHVHFLRHCYGKGVKVSQAAMPDWNAKEGEVNGGHWIRSAKNGVRRLAIDTNHWKTFVQDALTLFPLDQFSISLFAAAPHLHRLLVEHLTAEAPKYPKSPEGKTIEQWEKRPGQENHWLDCLCGATCLASELGVVQIAIDNTPPPRNEACATSDQIHIPIRRRSDMRQVKNGRKGRPKGQLNQEYDTVDATLTKCLKCGSTERTAYRKDPVILRQVFSDKTITTVWRKTRCANCGRLRRDKYRHEQPIGEHSQDADSG